MDDRQRELVLLIGIISLVIMTMAFLVSRGEIGYNVSRQLGNTTAVKGAAAAVNDSVNGWQGLMRALDPGFMAIALN